MKSILSSMQVRKIVVTLIISCIGFSSVKAVDTPDEFYIARANRVVDQIADSYTPPAKNIGDPEKYYWPKAMARFYKYGTEDTQANEYIDELCVKGAFHFAIVGMTRLICQFPDAPSIQDNLDKILDKNLGAGLTTTEGTENHLSMERTSIYLFAQEKLKRDKDNPIAKECMELTKEWILTWAKRAYEYGVGEWNSSTYATYNLIGWLNLYDFADDTDIKDAAKAVADYYATEIALHYSWGTIGGCDMRGNKETDKNRTSTSYLAWLWYADSEECPQELKPAEYIQLMHPILSTYTPPAQVVELAHKDKGERLWYQNSKPSYLYEHKSFCKQDFYISENFTLGNLVSSYGGYTGASYAIIPWRLVIRQDDACPHEIGGNGRYRDSWSGQSRSPFTQTVQFKNTLILMNKIPTQHDSHYEKVVAIVEQWQKDWDADYQKRHNTSKESNVVTLVDGSKRQPIAYLSLPNTLKTEISGNNVYVDAGNVFLVITTLHSPKTSTRGESGRILVMDESEIGELAAYALEVIEKTDIADIETLKEQTQETNLTCVSDSIVTYQTLNGDQLEATFQGYGTCIEPLFDWGYGATEAMCMPTAPPFRQPDWGYDDGFGKIPAFSVNGTKIDYNTQWPVYNGAQVSMEGSILRVKGSDSIYIVDYSNEKPTWTIDDSAVDIVEKDNELHFEWNFANKILSINTHDNEKHLLSIHNIAGQLLFKKTFKSHVSLNLDRANDKYFIVTVDDSSVKVAE